MTVEEVRSILPLDESENVVMDLFSCYISPNDFVERFDGANLTHASLTAHANATDGWRAQFDAWKADGILS